MSAEACAEPLAGFFSRVVSIAWRRFDASGHGTGVQGNSLRHGAFVASRRTFCGVRIPTAGAELLPGRIRKGERAASSVECKRCASELPGLELLGGLS